MSRLLLLLEEMGNAVGTLNQLVLVNGSFSIRTLLYDVEGIDGRL